MDFFIEHAMPSCPAPQKMLISGASDEFSVIGGEIQ